MTPVKEVKRWETSDGRVWTSWQQAEAERAVLDLTARLSDDQATADVHRVDIESVIEALRRDPQGYAALLTAIAETRQAWEAKAAEELLERRP